MSHMSHEKLYIINNRVSDLHSHGYIFIRFSPIMTVLEINTS